MRADLRTTRSPAPSLVVFGPSGCGKSTLGRALAAELGTPFLEGDEYHPPRNIAKMTRGEALTDRDREPFLDELGRALARQKDGAVAACSALKRSHRDQLRQHHPQLVFIWPRVQPEELERRLGARDDHFMPLSLLQSQLETFEPPTPDENCLVTDGERPVAEQVREIERALPRLLGRAT